MTGNRLYVRSYAWDEGEVVVGNRRDISDPVPEVIETEFVFRGGELLTTHVLEFKQ
jgi:hypothetical protein